MKLNDLMYFKYLAESQSFTKTAEKYFVSQPSISISLKRLEDEFNTTLVTRDRSTKSVELTEAGKILYHMSIELLSKIESTKNKIHNLESEIVYLGFLPTIGGHFLPKILPSLSNYVGSLKLVEEESSDAMFQLVADKKISCAIVGSDQSHFHEQWVTQIPIAEKELAIWVSPSHPLAKYNELDVSDLLDTPFVCLAKGYTHQRIFERWTKDNHIDLMVHYTDEIQTANSMIASGMSASLMIDLLVRDRPDIIKIPLKDAPKFYVSLIVNNFSEATDIQKEFNTKLIKAVKENFPTPRST